MPDPKNRKRNKSALQRVDEKYILVDKEQHPHRLYPPVKKPTENFRKLMETRNFIRIMTQIGLNKYIVLQYYVFCDEDIWLCGDSLLLNSNPDKKILGQCLCVKTRKVCCAYNEDSHEHFIICPKCKQMKVAVRNTTWKCNNCGFAIPHNLVEDAPFLTMQCEFCPVEIGWEKVDEICKNKPEFYVQMLQIKSSVMQKMMEENMKNGDEFDVDKNLSQSLAIELLNKMGEDKDG